MVLLNKLKMHALQSLIPAQYNREAILSLIDKVDVVSFDMFDTLVMRNVARPIDLFLILEKKYLIENFCLMRMEAEQDARKLKNEIRLNDIYVEMGRKNNCSQINKIMRDELELERIICKPNLFMKDIYESIKLMGKKIIIVSDMYLSKKFLSEILLMCGYTNFSDLYVSCEHGVSKHEGLLQKKIRNCEGIKHCVHIGDNIISDVIRSKAAGWKTIYYPKTNEMKQICNRKGDWCYYVANGIYINALYDELLNVSTDYKNGFKTGWLESIKEEGTLLEISSEEEFAVGKESYYEKYSTVLARLEAFMANF